MAIKHLLCFKTIPNRKYVEQILAYPDSASQGISVRSANLSTQMASTEEKNSWRRPPSDVFMMSCSITHRDKVTSQSYVFSIGPAL